MKLIKTLLACSAATALATSAFATDLEVTHWWTSGGEAAAVAEASKQNPRQKTLLRMQRCDRETEVTAAAAALGIKTWGIKTWEINKNLGNKTATR